MNNPIIDEVRESRAALAAEHDYDVQRMFEWAKKAHAERQVQLAAQRKVQVPPKKPTRGVVAAH